MSTELISQEISNSVSEGELIDPEEDARVVNEIVLNGLTSDLSWRLAAGEKLLQKRQQLGGGPAFKQWCDTFLDFDYSTAHRYASLFVWVNEIKRKYKADLTDAKVAVEVIRILIADSTPPKARTEILKRIRGGEAVLKKSATEIVKKHTPPKTAKKDDKLAGEDGLIQCLKCDGRFGESEFADPTLPIMCAKCQEQHEQELQDEYELVKAWAAADDTEREQLQKYIARTDVPKTTEEELPPIEIMLDLWPKLGIKLQKQFLKAAKIEELFFTKKPVTLKELKEYIKEKGYHFDPEKFMAHYESNGWKVGRNKMKSWKSSCVTWEKTWLEDNKEKNGSPEDAMFFS